MCSQALTCCGMASLVPRRAPPPDSWASESSTSSTTMPPPSTAKKSRRFMPGLPSSPPTGSPRPPAGRCRSGRCGRSCRSRSPPRVGCGLRCSNPTAPRIIPGVHQPHCRASASRNASCTGCSLPSGARPSMVTMRLPATLPTLVMHERVGTPSISTVHAAHCPSPQPYLVPVRSRSSRRTLRSVRSGSASMRRLEPLTSSSVILAIRPSYPS